MSNQQVNKVDLSLDDIIRLDKKQKHGKSQGSSSQGRGHGSGGGHKNSGVRGGGSSRTGSLNKKKTGTGSGGQRGQAGRIGQRGNLRGRAGNRNRGTMNRGSSSSSRGGSVMSNTNSAHSPSQRGFRTGGGIRGNFRGDSSMHPTFALAAQSGFNLTDIENKLSQVLDKHRLSQLQLEDRNLQCKKVVLDKRYDRQRLFCESDDLLIVYDCKKNAVFDWFVRKDRQRQLTHFEEDAQNCVKSWPPVNGQKFELLLNLMSVNTAILSAAIRHFLGARGSSRGALRGWGGRATTAPVQQGKTGYLARGKMANHSASQRGGEGGGVGWQQLPDQGLSQGHMSSGVSRLSLKQQRQLALQALQQARLTVAQLDQQTARQNFVNARRGIAQQSQSILSQQNKGMYASTMSLASTTSQSSIGSGRHLQGTKVTAFTPSPSPSVSSSPTRGRRGHSGRRWRPKSQAVPNSTSTLTISIDNNAPVSNDFSAPQASIPVPRKQLKRRQFRRRDSNSSFESVDYSRGATPSFSHQLAKLKPTVSTKYVFQKKAFATGNTTFSLNDRFSDNASEDVLGRKVFM